MRRWKKLINSLVTDAEGIRNCIKSRINNNCILVSAIYVKKLLHFAIEIFILT